MSRNSLRRSPMKPLFFAILESVLKTHDLHRRTLPNNKISGSDFGGLRPNRVANALRFTKKTRIFLICRIFDFRFGTGSDRNDIDRLVISLDILCTLLLFTVNTVITFRKKYSFITTAVTVQKTQLLLYYHVASAKKYSLYMNSELSSFRHLTVKCL